MCVNGKDPGKRVKVQARGPGNRREAGPRLSGGPGLGHRRLGEEESRRGSGRGSVKAEMEEDSV